MHRDEALRIVLLATRGGGAALFAGNGFVARAAVTIDDRPLNFAMLGSMSLAPALAAGFAHRTGLPVVVVEGDGNALMGLSSLPAVAAALAGGDGHAGAGGHAGGGGARRGGGEAARGPFVHVVLDNGVYESTGGQRTLSPRVDLCAIAVAAGYPSARAVTGGAVLTAAMAEALARPGPTYLRVRVDPAPGGPGRAAIHPRVPRHPRDIARRFVAAAVTAKAAKADKAAAVTACTEEGMRRP